MKKMKRWLSVALSAMLIAGSMSAFAACGGRGEGAGGEEIDPKRSQLYVRNYQGGFGNKWLYNGKAKLEAKYAGESFEDGKQGIQVIITDIKATPDVENIKNDVYDVYFVEKVSYLYLAERGVMEDLTDIVTTKSSYDGKAIVDKLTEQQKDFYGIETAEGTKYYALPHYMAPIGIVYDKDLFADRGYYFIEGYENTSNINAKFGYPDEDVLSAGPDGVSGNDDDGLPATYADFWDLCEYIATDGNVPLNWGGTGSTQFYLGGLMYQLMADYQGKDTFMKNFTMEGTMDEIVKLDSNGKIIYGQDGLPATESVELNGVDNGYLGYRHVSYYHALEFMKKMADTVGEKIGSGVYSLEKNITSGTYDAFAAQKEYVASRWSSSITDQAMLVEGSWWDSEATPYFDDNVKNIGAHTSKEHCNYGWMPLPKATQAQVDKKIKNTMVNTIDSLCFIKKGIKENWKLPIALDFVQMMNSDEALADFTVQTNAFKDFNYTLSEDQVKGLSPFGKEMYKAWNEYDIVFPHDNNDQYYKTIYTTSNSRRYAINSSDIFPAYTFMTKDITAASYFESSVKYAKDSISLWKNK